MKSLGGDALNTEPPFWSARPAQKEALKPVPGISAPAPPVNGAEHRPGIMAKAGYSSLSMKGSIWRKVLIQSMLREDSDVQDDFYREHGCRCESWTQLRYSCYRLVSRKWFEYLMGLIIVANALAVGYEIQLSLSHIADWMFWIDFTFVMIYLVELTIRFLAWGKKCFLDPWCILDMVLVALGVLSLFTNSVGVQVQELESLLVVRSFRLLRLMRALRLLKQFRTVWRLVSGLLTSANAMLSTLVLVILTLYIAACLGIEVITKDASLSQTEETAGIVSQYFGSLFMTLLTLSSFVTLDSVAPIYSPLITEKPSLTLYFFFIVLFVSVALMNLVTAVLVEGALANASADKELEKLDLREKLQNEMPRLLAVFGEIDRDGSGTLTMEEMSLVPIDIIPEELRAKSNISTMHDVFEMLDVDGGGELTREEFVDGLLNLFLHDVPATSVQTLRLLRSVDNKVNVLADQVRQLQYPGRGLHRRQISIVSSRSDSTDLHLGSA
ncbi:Scn5a [Symbiodinium natans]|uniref:Scn5a protein n=1 Tax=Symbiodinium natans TaxID=878477 RepID=A0A812V9Y0_9DINO|nr:Scn5a [Symbiodinium natans]